MRIFMPIIFIALFVLYVLYITVVKKELKQNLYKVVYPGLFFITVWGTIYYFMIE
ncbi:hypothetical protein C8C84_2317 [Flavobacterium sp. 102]|nr:hypothetical protein C8C84_2317 [Flavobacterium sp. 102]